MSKILFSLFILVISLECRADVQISSDFYFAVDPKNYASSLLKQPLAGKESFSVPTWNIGGEYHSSAEDIRMDFEYDLKLQATQDPVKYSYLMQLGQGTLKIGKIKTNAVIIKNVGGVMATVYLKGECRNLSITTQDKLDFTGEVRLGIKNQALGAYLQTLQTQNEQSWTMSIETCEGPKGYQQELEKQLRAFIANKQKMQEVLIQPFQKEIDKKVAVIHAQLFAEKHMSLNENVEVSLLPQIVDLDEVTGQILLTGLAKTSFKSSKDENKYIEAKISKEEFSQLSKNGFLFSQKYLTALVEGLHDSRFLYKSYLAQQIPGLSTLFSSRLIQFFLWPDLMNFKRKAAFTFEVESKTKPNVQFHSFSKGNAWFGVGTQLSVLTRTPQNVGAHEYGHFSSPYQSHVWLKVHEGKLALGVYNPKMNLKFKWSETYLNLFRPFKSISAGFFGQKIQSALKDFRWTSQLPAIEMEGQVLLRPKSLSGNKDWLVLEYSP